MKHGSSSRVGTPAAILIFTSLLLAGVSAGTGRAQDAPFQFPLQSMAPDPRESLSLERDYAWRQLQTPMSPHGWNDRLAQQSMSPEPPPVRPPGLAFLFSALVPGAGQLYNGNNRGYLFLGIEAAAWFARISYREAGNNQEGRYETFARRHWDYDRFRETAGADGCLWSEQSDSLIFALRNDDPEQFYEEIGKQEFYRCGWDDFRDNYDPNDETRRSPHRAEYLEMRERSNDLLGNARLALGILVLNRIVSAVDAFRTAKSRNEGAAPEVGAGLRLESRMEGSWHRPRAVLQLVKVLP